MLEGEITQKWENSEEKEYSEGEIFLHKIGSKHVSKVSFSLEAKTKTKVARIPKINADFLINEEFFSTQKTILRKFQKVFKNFNGLGIAAQTLQIMSGIKEKFFEKRILKKFEVLDMENDSTLYYISEGAGIVFSKNENDSSPLLLSPLKSGECLNEQNVIYDSPKSTFSAIFTQKTTLFAFTKS